MSSGERANTGSCIDKSLWPTLLQDRERAEAMGQAGRERVEKHFSVERMVQETETLYEELIREKMRVE